MAKIKICLASGLLFVLFTAPCFAHPTFKCSGTEPFWGLTLGRSPIFSREGTAYPLKNVSPEHINGQWIWQTHTRGDMQPVTIVVQQQDCSNGMSDQPFAYEVTYTTQQQTYHGCCETMGAPYK